MRLNRELIVAPQSPLPFALLRIRWYLNPVIIFQNKTVVGTDWGHRLTGTTFSPSPTSWRGTHKKHAADQR
jgi:hypothetical protein